MLELDETGAVITYEEYHPYGSTAFATTNGNAEVSAKRYRYTGKEKDLETGLYYHGARYYAPWLGRWTAADRKGIQSPGSVDLDLFAYVRSNPIKFLDESGYEEKTPSPAPVPGPGFAPPGPAPKAPAPPPKKPPVQEPRTAAAPAKSGSTVARLRQLR
jgi:RHS repeat-associated protein